MARLRTIEKRNNSQAIELSQFIEGLRRVSEKFECPESELAVALEQQTRHQPDPVGSVSSHRYSTSAEFELVINSGSDEGIN